MNVGDYNLNPLLDDEGAGLKPLVQLLYHLRFQNIENNVFSFQRFKEMQLCRLSRLALKH